MEIDEGLWKVYLYKQSSRNSEDWNFGVDVEKHAVSCFFAQIVNGFFPFVFFPSILLSYSVLVRYISASF